MATATPRPAILEVDYPTSDGKPMAETELHRDLMFRLIHALSAHFAADPNVCVTGNLLLYYEQGNKRKHVSPDVFFARGVPKRVRKYYLMWEEGQGPQVVIELSSASTSREDQTQKFELYRDVLKVQEYFLFDPYQEYLKPPLKGYRLEAGTYRPILPVEGRLPSEELHLHFEAAGEDLKLWNPDTRTHLLVPAEAARRSEQQALEVAASEREQRKALEKENARLRTLLEKLGQDPTAPDELDT